ncbi:MAG: nucleoside-diphosphate kinase [Candidatus Thermoplasmatota archaeon]|nr:nucleoside-diphosphate kinase [Candidatus Thermoplasmatota archaeon]
MGKEQTFVMIKPDGVQRGLIGRIVQRFEQRGIKIKAMKLVSVSKELAEKHYGIHKGKPFFEPTVEYITSSPVVAMVLEGENVISLVRKMMGKTNPSDAQSGTIRGDFGQFIGRNIIHGSDGEDTAAFEIGLWFSKDELTTYNRIDEPWLIE